MRIFNRIMVFMLLSLVTAAALSWSLEASGGNSKVKGCHGEQSAKREKSRYYFLEGVRHQIEGRGAEAYECFRHANLIDPQFPEAGYYFGQMRMTARNDTLFSDTELAKSFALMKPYIDSYPKDYDEVISYGYAASHYGFPEEAIRVFERTDSLFPDRTSTLLYLADTYFSADEEEKGLNALNRYEKIEGKSPNITLRKISYLIHKRDTTAALREASELVASDTGEPAYLILKGNLFQLMEEKDSTESYLKRAEEISPGYGPAKLALADFYLAQGDSARYDEKTYDALLAEDFGLEEKTELLSQYLAKLLSDSSDTRRGDYLFSVLEQQYPYEVEVMDLSARYNAAKGKFEDALEKIDHAIDLNGNNERYWGQKMSYLVSADRWKDAMETYEEAVKHVEPTMGLRVIGATAGMIGKDYPFALARYSELIRDIAPASTPDSVQLPRGITLEGLEQLSGLYTSVGDCYYYMKDLDRAFRSYENALSIDPENTLALNNYAYFLEENGGDLEKAASLSERSLRGENAENPTYLDTYAWILYKQGKYEEALSYQKKAIEKVEGTGAESEDLWDHYGDILKANGERREAVKAWERARDLAEDKTEITKKINENK